MCYRIDFSKLFNDRSAKRRIALTFCILFIALFLISEIFIFTHINHDHDCNGPGGSCATCYHVMMVENLIRSISTALIGATLAACGFLIAYHAPRPANFSAGISTLVHLKVRLNS